ncbi:unnamed protein product [Calypogeia fissa]
MIRVVCHLQEHQVHSPAYILENVPLLGDSHSRVVASMHQVREWVGPAVLLDAASIGALAHRPRLWWTNLLPPEVLKVAYSHVVRPIGLTVDSILDAGRRSQAVGRDDAPPLAVVNKIGFPRAALPTLLSFPGSHAYRSGGSNLVWDERLQQLVEPNVDEQERAMGFVTGTTTVPEFSEATRRQLLGQVMDLNCLTWVVALGLAEQWRMRTTLVASYPLVSLQPTEMVQAAAGGVGPREGRWDFISQNPGLQKRHPWTS